MKGRRKCTFYEITTTRRTEVECLRCASYSDYMYSLQSSQQPRKVGIVNPPILHTKKRKPSGCLPKVPRFSVRAATWLQVSASKAFDHCELCNHSIHNSYIALVYNECIDWPETHKGQTSEESYFLLLLHILSSISVPVPTLNSISGRSPSFLVTFSS